MDHQLLAGGARLDDVSVPGIGREDAAVGRESQSQRLLEMSSFGDRRSVPSGASATPVGPIASAFGSSRHGIAFAITVWLSTFGGWLGWELTPILTTVELSIV
jgi:hypothetical protein